MFSNAKISPFILGLTLLVLLVSACTPTAPGPTQAPQVASPTVDTMAITQTFQALVTAAQGTVSAELTAQPPQATQTPLPTQTPIVITATARETAATQAATAAATSAAATTVPAATTAPGQQVTATRPATPGTAVPASCTIVSQRPAFGQDFRPREDLDLSWIVRNTSGQQWNIADVDYVFVSGTEFHKQAAYDLRENTAANDEVEILVDALAPALPGRYSATWAIVRGGQRLCTMSATFDVVE